MASLSSIFSGTGRDITGGRCCANWIGPFFKAMRFKAARNPRLRRARLFLRLIEHKTLARADPLKGKFCSFLFTSFKNYLCTEAERSHRHKRGGHYEFVSLDLEDAENRYRLEATDTLSAEKIFDARWALTLLGRTMTRLAEEYATQGRASLFETLKVFLKAGGSCSPSYEEAAKALGVSLGAAKSLIHRLRQRCTSILREEVARTVSDPDEIDAEIHALCTALIASGGSLEP